MENNNNGGQAPQLDTVKPIWEVMGGQEDVVTITTPTTPAAIQSEDVITPIVDIPAEPAKAEVVEPAKEEVKKEIEEPAKTDVKATDKEVVTPTDDALELTVADIKDVPVVHDEGSWKGVASDLGFEVAEDTFEAFTQTFKENYVPKSEVEKLATVSRESLLATLDPKIATAFELIEMGVPQELALNPTKIQDDYLAMDNASLMRAALTYKYQGVKDLTPQQREDMVEAKLEELVEDPSKLEIQANIVRADVMTDKQNILQEQAQLVQKFTEQKQQVAYQQKVEADNQFKEALTKESTFMGLKLSQDVKDAILKKYSTGAYEDALNPAQAKLRAILQLEYGDKFAKAVQSKAKEEGKAEIVRKLSDIPPKATQGGSRVQVVSSDNHTENKSPLANVPIFGE